MIDLRITTTCGYISGGKWAVCTQGTCYIKEKLIKQGQKLILLLDISAIVDYIIVQHLLPSFLLIPC